MSPDYMDAVCQKGDWDVVSVYSKKKKLEGLLVYHTREFLGMRFILMPPMCFYNGIRLFHPEGIKTHSLRSFEEKTTESLINALPQCIFYYQQYDPAFTNWAPLYWKGYSQSTRYTYRIDTRIGEDDLLQALKPNVRRHIQKAEKLTRIEDGDIKSFLTALQEAYKDRPNPFDLDLLNKLYHAFYPKGNCSLKLCLDSKNGSCHAGVMILNDHSTSYYVCGFYNPEYKNLGGISFLLWHSITQCQTVSFDFEGSMIRDIEYFFRGFGGEWTPHFRIWKINSRILAPFFKLKFRSLLHA